MIRRADNKLWATPGGCHDLNETPQECAERECREESGYEVSVTNLLGVFSSNRYEYVHYPWKENQFCHLLFAAKIVGGKPKPSCESIEISWFGENELPTLSDGHLVRIEFGFRWLKQPTLKPFFE